MKRILFFLIGLMAGADVYAASTIDTTNRYAYSANAGWLDARADGTNGAVIGEYVCSGYVYGANIGWISLGGGSPTNGIYYSNSSANDWGVNNVGGGQLRGYAYGANIGWLNFETNGSPAFNRLNGQMSGYVWSANIGWVSLSNASAFVQTDTIAPGADTDGDGIPDAWELQHATNLTAYTATSDTDHDGVSDRNEYLAGTDPQNAADFLHITVLGPPSGVGTRNVTWASNTNRFYYINASNTNLISGVWLDSGIGQQAPDSGTTTMRTVPDAPATSRFFRIQAARPLMP